MNTIHLMHHAVAEREYIREAIAEGNHEVSVKVAFVKALMLAHHRAEFADVLSDLKAIDPDGWEAWFDRDLEDGSWQYMTKQVVNRITELLM